MPFDACWQWRPLLRAVVEPSSSATRCVRAPAPACYTIYALPLLTHSPLVLAAGTAAPFAITADDAPFVSNNANVLIGHRPPPPREAVPIGILLDSLAGRSREAVARAADDAGRFVRVRMQEQRAA